MRDESQSELAFAQDGDDLLVTISVRANNSAHVLWKRVHIFRGRVIPAGGHMEDAIAEHRIILQYWLFQNRDLFTRSFKSVDVTWRVRGHQAGVGTYQVEPTFWPDSVELLELLPQLKALADQATDR